MGRRTWDVQRDHVALLAGVSRLLAQGGHALFSCNLRSFRPETRKLARAGVVLEDITAPVSYTHLDVYKRQGHGDALFKNHIGTEFVNR